MAGVSCGADFIFIPENPPTENWEEEMCTIVRRHRQMGKRKTIVIVAEGATDRKLNPVTPTMVKDLLSNKVGLDTRVTTLGHVQVRTQRAAFVSSTNTIVGSVVVHPAHTTACCLPCKASKLSRRSSKQRLRRHHQ